MAEILNFELLQNPPAAGLFACTAGDGRTLRIYSASIHPLGHRRLFLFRDGSGRHLGLFEDGSLREPLSGVEIEYETELAGGGRLKSGPLSQANAQFLRELFPWTAPRLSSPGPSFGLGDRLGTAGPAHIRAVRGTGLFPILAQQSIRELERTCRTPEQVIDCATFAAFQEDLQTGFGADGDHLKTTSDIDRVIAAGFLWFTIDPGDHVVNEADLMGISELESRASGLPWDRLGRSIDSIKADYSGKRFQISDELELAPGDEEIWRGWVKYGNVIAHVHELHSHLQRRFGSGDFELELSVDETDSVTSPFEHFLVASELQRLGVRIDSLAPRFVGRFEKGVDFRGSRSEFEAQLGRHVAVAKALGPYKLSLHSGSDKFSIYPAFGRLCGEWAHVKTAGTSYLEALRATTQLDLELFREILEFSTGIYPKAKASYHVSAELSRVPPAKTLNGEDAARLFDDNDDARQVLHVAYGDVLCAEAEGGRSRFRDRLEEVLDTGEETHFRCLEKHFARHFSLLES